MSKFSKTISISLDKKQMNQLLEKAHKRNLTLKQYLKLLVINL